MKIDDLPVYMLSSFGHAGIDWTHSLLDMHKDIIIMPAFSFFRTLHKIQKINKIQIKNLSDPKYASEILGNMFYDDASYQLKRRKFLFDLEQKKIFCKNISDYLTTNNKSLIYDLFFAIHYAFCKTHKIDINKKKCIVAHEHVAWHFPKYKKYFNSKNIIIFRDPKAVLGGGILRMKNSNKSKKINSYQMDTMLLHMFSAYELYKLNRNNLYPLTNESMHKDLRHEMTKLANWMNIDFSETMLKQSFMGINWLGESSYLAKDELHELPPANFYDPIEVKKRWSSVLTKKDIIFIEVIFDQFIRDFKYDLEEKKTFKKILKGYYYFFFNYQFQEKYYLNKFIILLRNIIRRLSIILLKEKTINIFTFK